MRIKKNNYKKYVEAQKAMVKRHQKYLKTKKLSEECSFAKDKHLSFVLEKLKEYNKDSAKYQIICHGVRNGYESKFFMNYFGKNNVYSTDIIDVCMLDDKTNFFEQDFDTEIKEWENKFDFLYSNAIDHSQNPNKTLKVWSKQIKKNGVLFIQFHGGSKVINADCFALDLNNYKKDINKLIKNLSLKTIYVSKRMWRRNKRSMSINVIFKKI